MKADVLRRPFSPNQVKQRQGQGGKVLSYVATHAVIAPLNEGLDSWSFEIVRHEVLDDEVVVVGRLTADGLVKMAFGGSALTRDRDGRCVSIADDLKSAGSDALKKAASLLGVALELYGAGPEQQEGGERNEEDRRAPATPRLDPAELLVSAQDRGFLDSPRRRSWPGRGTGPSIELR